MKIKIQTYKNTDFNFVILKKYQLLEKKLPKLVHKVLINLIFNIFLLFFNGLRN